MPSLGDSRGRGSAQVMDALRLVFRSPINAAIGAVAFVLLSLAYLWESQVIILASDGIRTFWEPQFVVAALVLSGLFAVLLPLQISAFRLAAASTLETGGTVLGVVIGT